MIIRPTHSKVNALSTQSYFMTAKNDAEVTALRWKHSSSQAGSRTTAILTKIVVPCKTPGAG